MAEPGANAPVIIKRKKVIAGDGHHGGAWKVAYADFVTAMMAFFMLMWLLNATTEKQRKGIADYFNPTIPVNRISGGGEGMFGGTSVFSEEALPQNGTGGSNRNPSTERQSRGATGVDISRLPEEAALGAVKEALDALLEGQSGESAVADPRLEHIVTRVTDEGLVVEIFDLPGAPLFKGDSDRPTLLLRQLVSMISGVFRAAANPIAIRGHTRAWPVVLRENPGWDLSTARAHRARLLLEANGTKAERIHRVAGASDRRPAASDPMALRNNRLEIILLRKVPGDGEGE